MNSQNTNNVQQLHEEFKTTFPDLTDDIILTCISQCGADKEMCTKILESIQLPRMEEFDSDEINQKQENYDFKFNGELQNDPNSMVREMNDLLITSKTEMLYRKLIANENVNVQSSENQVTNAINGNFLPTTKSGSYNMYNPPTSIHRTSNFGYMEHPTMHMVNQQDKTSDMSVPYGHNYGRGFSYPATSNGNAQYHSQFSHPASKLNPDDYRVPLYIMVTSPSYYPTTTMTNSQPRFLLPLSTQQGFYTSMLPHLTPSYHASEASMTSFSQSLQPSLSHYPTSVTPSSSNATGSPALTVSPNVPYAYPRPFFLPENPQRDNEFANYQKYNMFSQSSTANFINKNSCLNLPSTISPTPFSSVLLLPHPQNKDTKDNQAERAYRKALIQHQKMQFEMLHIEAMNMKQFCYTLRKDVNLLEEKLQEKRKNEYSNMEEMQKLREENMSLRVECKCLELNADMLQKGQSHLGVVDEGFYKNIFTGPPIPSTNQEKKEANSSANATNSHYEEGDEIGRWNCLRCTYANHPALDHCEMCDSSRVLAGV